MKNNVLYFLVILALGACKSPVLKATVIPESWEYLYFTDSEIDGRAIDSGLGHPYEIISGDKMVFKYAYSGQDQLDIADDEYYEELVFEVDQGSTSFEVTGDEIWDTNPNFNYLCNCMPNGTVKSITGYVKGQQVSTNGWSVEVDITYTFEPGGATALEFRNIKFNGGFQLN